MDLHTKEWGEPGGSRVLLLHGLQSSSDTWYLIAEGLAAYGAHVVAPDLRGHGRSPAGERYTFADFVSDLEPGWDLVVGHSLGGVVAAQALQQDPSFARAAVLIDPPFFFPDEEFEAVLAGQLAEREAARYHIQVANPRWTAEDVQLKYEASQRCAPAVIEGVLRGNRPWDHAQLLDGLDALVIGGHPDRGGLFPPELAPARYELVEHAGHSVHRDDPDVVILLLTQELHARAGREG